MRRAIALVLGLSRFGLTIFAARLRRADLTRAVGVNLREFLGRMGFTYVKLGQYLALRFDLLPAEVCTELRGLFDQAPTMPFDEVVRQIERELGMPVNDCFRSLDTTCLAAASLAQVHLGVTIDGERVAVKVQRPNAQRDFEADMWLARLFARGLDGVGLMRSLSITSIVDEFVDATRRELDFRTEGRVAMGVRSRTNPGILVPWVHWNLSSARVLTMEFVDGVTLSAATALARRGRIDELADLLPGVDLGSIVRRVADESLRQVLVDGLFHADPHPGNIIVCRDGTIAYVDFGSFGRLTRRQRQDCSGYISQNALGNYERGFRHFFRLMLPTADVDYRSFKRSSIEVIRVWSERSQEAQASPVERHLGTVMLRTMAAMRLHGVRPAPEFLLFWRVLFQVDSMALEMGDSVDMFAIVREFFEDSGHASWYHIDGSAHRVPVDAAPMRRAVDRGADLAGASRQRMPHGATQTSSRPARSVKMRRTLMPTFAIVFVACAVLLGGLIR